MNDHLIDCPRCNGTGKVVHECTNYNLKTLKTLWEHGGHGSGESLVIRQCRVCKALWKIRYQWDAGTGSDNIWIRVGESDRGYTFTQEEADAILAEQPKETP